MSDVGFGKFNSDEWHNNKINGMEDIGAICWYVFNARDAILKPGHSLEETKKLAIELMMAH